MANKKGSKHFSVGDTRTNNNGNKFTVLEYYDANNVVIQWPCGATDSVTSGNIVAGSVRYYNERTVNGVGFLGYGRFVHGLRKVPDGKFAIPKQLHRHWRHMLSRATGNTRPARYCDAQVCEDWHNLQNFLEWAILQEGYNCVEDNGKSWHLDKDIVVRGNKLYSPETCVFVPNEINTFFSDKDIGTTGKRGVNHIQPASAGAQDGYVARCHVGSIREYLGYYDTPEQAHAAYFARKLSAARALADKWHGSVDVRVIRALRNFGDRLREEQND